MFLIYDRNRQGIVAFSGNMFVKVTFHGIKNSHKTVSRGAVLLLLFFNFERRQFSRLKSDSGSKARRVFSFLFKVSDLGLSGTARIGRGVCEGNLDRKT